MITIFLRGGLGNQMFQYALGLHLAKKNKTELLVDTTFLNDRIPRPQFTYRKYDLDIFNIEPRFTTLSKFSNAVRIPGVWLGLDLMLMGARDVFGRQKMVIEDERFGDIFDPKVLDVGPRALLYGRWSSEKYFADIADDVRAAFTFRRPLEGEAATLAEKIKSCHSVSLHVRRGDYLLPKYAKEYGATDTSYYDRALAYIGKQVADPHIFVFSDDIAWCRENIKPLFPTTYVDDTTRGYKAAGHLELMSHCRHHIIANSSFSWWGAWLDPRPDMIVVAPKKWRVGVEQDDAVPEGWLKI